MFFMLLNIVTNCQFRVIRFKAQYFQWLLYFSTRFLRYFIARKIFCWKSEASHARRNSLQSETNKMPETFLL